MSWAPFPPLIAIPLGPEGGAGFVGDGVADSATIAELKGRHMLLDTYASLFDAAPATGRLSRCPTTATRSSSAYFLVPDAGDPEGVLETARLADRLGYDLLAVQDHPYQRAHLDALALLGVILAQTERIRVFQDVGNLPLRPPAVFAKAAATLDLLSGGRFEAGLGGGGFLDAAQAMGAPALTPGESLEALEEAVAILRASWNGARSLRFDGRHYRSRARGPGPRRRTRSASGSAPRSRARWRSPGAWPMAGPPR